MPPKRDPSQIAQSLSSSTQKAAACMKQKCKPELDKVKEKNKAIYAKLDVIRKEVKDIVTCLKRGTLKKEDAKPKLIKATKASETLILKGLKNEESSHACAVKNCSTEIMALFRAFEELLELMCASDKRSGSLAALCETKKDVSEIVSGKKKLDTKSYQKVWGTLVRNLASSMQRSMS